MEVVNSPQDPNRSADIRSAVLPNILDRYSTYTYHFRLFMMSENAILERSFGPGSADKRIILAETAATTVGIDEVTIVSRGAITKEAGVGLSTNFKLVVRQPFGATFVDFVAQSAATLGIKNYQKAPYYLELTFRARDPETQQPIEDDDITHLRWIWPITFTSMSIDVNAGGSIYTIEAAVYGDISYSNQAADLQKTVSVTCSTVGEFFQGLEDQLNSREEDKEVSNQTKPNKYTFYVDEDIAKEKLILENAVEVAGRAGEFEAEGNRTTITFHPRTSIEKIVEAVLSTTRYFQREAIGTDDPDSPSPDTNRRTIIKKLYRVIGDANIGDYDTGRNDYVRSFEYLIIPYETTTLQARPNERTTATSNERFNTYKERGLLRKVYNYIYTGLNDQVLDFNLNFNFNWYVALPWQAGLFTDPAAFDPGALRGREEDINDTADRQHTRAQSEAKAPMVRDRELQEREMQPEAIRPSDILGTITDSPLFEDGQADLVDNANVGNVLRGQDRTFDLPAARRQALDAFIADSERDIFAEKLAEKIEDINNNIDPFIISYIESTPAPDQNFAIEDSATPGRTLLSALFEQANSPIARDLLSIELKVKGDPYWLEPAPVGMKQPPISHFRRELLLRGFTPRVGTDQEIIQDVDIGYSSEDITARTTAKQTFFLFRTFSPQQFDQETGRTPKFTESNVLNGIYGVKTVRHEFINGMFTQTLEAIRDPNLNIRDISLNGLASLGVEANPPRTSNEDDLDPEEIRRLIEDEFRGGLS